MTLILITAACSYLLGSIPFGYILVRFFRDEDIRQSGSGNIGATNVARTSPALGGITLLLDAAKGTAAVAMAIVISQIWELGHPMPPSTVAIRAAMAGFLAVVGHAFPVWLKFKGGKGVATALGSFLPIAPKSLLLAIAIFLLLMVVFRYVSLASIFSVASMPFLVWLLRDYHGELAVLAYISLTSLLIVFRHHENIRRLLRGAEPRFRLRHG